MSLDVCLAQKNAQAEPGSGIFIRENGQNREITRAEWDKRFPGRAPVVARQSDDDSVFSANITHNLGAMAHEAGIYLALWHPGEIDIMHAAQLTPLLRAGLELLRSDPERFQRFNPPNGWGSYDGLVSFVERYLSACERFPDATVSVWG